MLQIERTLVNTESAYTANEIDYRKLEQLHTQFGSVELQATLIVGFVFTTMNADNLVALGDDNGKYCMYKTPVLTHLYIITTVLAVGLCMTCVMISAYIVWRSQHSANDISVRHTIALVRTLKNHVMATYFVGMGSFFSSFLLLLWIYFGQPNWVPLRGSGVPTGLMPGSREQGAQCDAEKVSRTGKLACDAYYQHGWDTSILIDTEGDTYVHCLNPFDAEQQEKARAIGLAVCLSATITAALIVMGGVYAITRIRRAFGGMEAIVEAQRREARTDTLDGNSGIRPAVREGPSVEMLGKRGA